MILSNIKKILIISLLLLFLTACGVKKEDLYTIRIGETSITVGYDLEEVVKDLDYIDTYECLLNKKEEYILQGVTIYSRDTSSDIYLDDYKLESIKDTCSLFNGEILSNNANVCVLHKSVKQKDNYVILSGDILADNTDKIDRIEVYYK